ncbi:glutamine amidotransferase [Bradyrhizobium prioriisuperbiae]|uniref:glutamine amidotransferase n=1 Tax=Bradyrhizobium prioriisuperbiae TaxID=2854389 RepID=UPI0028E199C7|nr:glutamine amidotransferase [Bradyrhizobium prioritasuperba]
MTKTAIAIRHIAFEDLGSFQTVLEAAGYTVQYRDAGVDDLRALRADTVDLLAVLGGPIGAYQDDDYPFLTGEISLIESRLALGRPTLGICLGAQLMARALGARVYPGPAAEIGWAPVTLTDAGRAGPLRCLADVAMLHWHGDTFDLPEGAERLASTSICANQAFAIGRNTLAFQFHPEAGGRDFERWLIGHASELARVGLSPQSLRADNARLSAANIAAGQHCLRAWLEELDRQ